MCSMVVRGSKIILAPLFFKFRPKSISSMYRKKFSSKRVVFLLNILRNRMKAPHNESTSIGFLFLIRFSTQKCFENVLLGKTFFKLVNSKRAVPKLGFVVVDSCVDLSFFFNIFSPIGPICGFFLIFSKSFIMELSISSLSGLSSKICLCFDITIPWLTAFENPKFLSFLIIFIFLFLVINFLKSLELLSIISISPTMLRIFFRE